MKRFIVIIFFDYVNKKIAPFGAYDHRFNFSIVLFLSSSVFLLLIDSFLLIIQLLHVIMLLTLVSIDATEEIILQILQFNIGIFPRIDLIT